VYLWHFTFSSIRLFGFYTKNQLKTIQKIEHNLAYMDYAMIFVYSFIGD
jgi:hypothetical protein